MRHLVSMSLITEVWPDSLGTTCLCAAWICPNVGPLVPISTGRVFTLIQSKSCTSKRNYYNCEIITQWDNNMTMEIQSLVRCSPIPLGKQNGLVNKTAGRKTTTHDARFTPNRDQIRTDLRVENSWISWTRRREQSSNFYRQIAS